MKGQRRKKSDKKWRVKSEVPHERLKGRTQKFDFYVWGDNEAEARTNAEAKLAHLLSGPGGIIHKIARAKPVNLKGGIGHNIVWSGV